MTWYGIRRKFNKMGIFHLTKPETYGTLLIPVRLRLRWAEPNSTAAADAGAAAGRLWWRPETDSEAAAHELLMAWTAADRRAVVSFQKKLGFYLTWTVECGIGLSGAEVGLGGAGGLSRE